MNIISHNNGDIKRVIVLGELKSVEDNEKFFYEMMQDGVKEIVITFMNARVLNSDTVLKLVDVMRHKQKVKYKIITSHSYLYSYFLRLNIKNVFYENHKYIENRSKYFKAIAIGGSAGSLEKVLRFIDKLPNSNASIFIVQHLWRKAPNLLPDILRERTKYKVVSPEDGDDIKEETIYIAPSDYHMIVERKKIRLVKGEAVNYARPSIDVLLRSLSKEYKEKLCSVLLCGYGSDGSTELSFLKENNSKIIIEDPFECEATPLLENAIKTGKYDEILPLEDIIKYVSNNIGEYYFDDEQFNELLEKIHLIYGFDYKNYRSESIKRRIHSAMVKLNIKDFNKFTELINNDPDSFEELFLEMSINVTEFFRDEDTFVTIKNKILPYLTSYLHIKIWCAGCSTGEEPYSLAILLSELGILNKCQIYATDINPYVIDEAKNGLYNEDKYNSFKQSYINLNGKKDLEEYFDKRQDIYSVKKNIKDKILFFQHSLLETGIINEFQLILCRNVLIYFDSELQEKILFQFSNSLDRNGFLVLGKSEGILSPKVEAVYSVFDKDCKIYKKSL